MEPALPFQMHPCRGRVLVMRWLDFRVRINVALQACVLGGSMRFVNSSYILFGLPLVSEYGSVVGLDLGV